MDKYALQLIARRRIRELAQTLQSIAIEMVDGKIIAAKDFGKVFSMATDGKTLEEAKQLSDNFTLSASKSLSEQLQDLLLEKSGVERIKNE